jgi:hypothetical protein
MNVIHTHRRVAVLTVAVVLALGVLALFAGFNAWSANAANPDKPSATRENPRSELVPVNPWDANGLSPAALHAAGWDCLYAVHAVHCVAPGELPSVTAGTAEEFTVLVFDTMDPESSEAPFLGEEVNIRADLFEGQPCPTDPPSEVYTYLPDLGLPLEYYGCHKFDSPL